MQGLALSDTAGVHQDLRWKELWQGTLTRFQATLTDEQWQQINTVKNLQELIGQVEVLRKRYAGRFMSRCFGKLQPVLEWLRGFDHCVHSFLQASPPEFVVLWGSLSFVLEISTRYFSGLEQVVSALDAACRAIPQFQFYSSLFTGEHYIDLHASLSTGLVEISLEFIGICQDAIAFFTRQPLWNLLIAAFRPLRSKTAPRLKRIENLKRDVDQNAILLAHHNSHQTLVERLNYHHSEIVQQIKPRRQSPRQDRAMLLGRLPFRSIPLGQNPKFFGREEELERLWRFLAPEARASPSALVRSACHGLAGSGKTQLALEFSYRHFEDFDAILWIAAETQLRVEESFKDIARKLGLITEDSVQHPGRVKDLMKEWFAQMSRGTRGIAATGTTKDNPVVKWLLIFDNVEDEAVIEAYQPQTCSGAVLVTCRSPETANRLSSRQNGTPCSVDVEVFDANSASQFLLSAANIASPVSPREEDAALLIAKSVGNHPLALDLIGNYIWRCGMTLQRFLQQYPTPERDILFHSSESSIANLWAMYLDDNKPNDNEINTPRAGLDENARLLIQMLALLDSDGAPLSLFTANTRSEMLLEGPDLPDEFPRLDDVLHTPFNNHMNFDQSRGSLFGSALARVGNEGKLIRCHRLVQIVVARSMTAHKLSVLFHKLVFFLNASFPRQADGRPLHGQWDRCGELASQVQALLASYKLYQDAICTYGVPLLLCEVICRCAWYLYEKGQYNVALDMIADGMSVCDAALASTNLHGNNHPGYSVWFTKDMASHLINVQATIARERPDSDHGLGLAQQVLDIRVAGKAFNGSEGGGIPVVEEERWIAAARGNLAVSLMGVNRTEEALYILLELLKRKDTGMNEDIYLSNAALCLSMLNRLEDAVSHIARAMESARRLRGEDSAQMAVCLFYLSSIESKRGDLAAAETHLKRCLQLRKQLMPHHHHTAFTHYKLGILLQKTGNYRESIDHLTEAHEILSTGESHPGAVCRTLLALAISYQHLDERSNVEACRTVAERLRARIRDDAWDLGLDPAKYDRFVTVGLR
ncbi:hypothetical protein OQA88_1440 [Cercophora sp. LCS_1]